MTRGCTVALAILACVGALPAATGGPDAFGYTWVDVNEPGGPPFVGVDISVTGAPVVFGDDVSSGAITLGAPFDLYGTVVTQLNMASNGYITTDLGDAGLSTVNDCPLPATPAVGGGMRIYPLHDDLELPIAFGRYQYFASCPRAPDRGAATGCSIFMWDEVNHFNGGGNNWDMWVYCYDTGDLVFEFGSGNLEEGSGSTTGIQDGPPPTSGLTVVCNTAASIPAAGGYVVHILHPNFPSCLLCGDSTGDGAVNILDALRCAQIAAGLIMPTLRETLCCDANSSASVDILDALVLAQDAAGLPVTLVCP